jgi:hypothetical protein
VVNTRGAPEEGGGAAGLQPHQTLQNRNLNTGFVGIMISKALRDLSFSPYQPLKSASDYYIRILQNKLIKFKKNQEDRTLWLSYGTCSYICIYINSVANNVLL